MQGLLKKFLFSLLIATTFLFSLAPFSQAKAQALWYNQGPFEWYAKVYDTTNSNEIFGERYTAAQVQWITYSVLFLPINLIFNMLGLSPEPLVCIANITSGTTDIDSCIKALIDMTNNLGDILATTNQNPTLATSGEDSSILKIIFTEDRQISGISYVRSLVHKLSPNIEVKAADDGGFGYNRLTPILSLWKITRNIAYFFFVIAMIIAAFMIMFKVKISPQAVVTLQTAIPKIAVSLILVTFSFAIAGFVIDLVYVIMGIFSQFFGNVVFFDPNAQGSPLSTFRFINGWLGEGFLSILVYILLYWILSMIISFFVAIFVLIDGGSVASFIFGALLLVFFIINIIILIVYLFVILFNLFKALANFYVAVIFGPIKLALGALPMSRGTFGKWIKTLFQHALVFPITGALFYFGFLFLLAALPVSLACGASDTDGATDLITAVANMTIRAGAPQDLIASFTSFVPNMACWGPPLLRDPGGATAIAFLLISASCILLMGKVPKMLKSMFEGQPFDMESAISDPVRMGAGATGTYIKERQTSGPKLKVLGEILTQASRMK